MAKHLRITITCYLHSFPFFHLKISFWSEIFLSHFIKCFIIPYIVTSDISIAQFSVHKRSATSVFFFTVFVITNLSDNVQETNVMCYQLGISVALCLTNNVEYAKFEII